MNLVRLHFKAFSQGSDIKADIKQGWCAGVTSLVSHEAGGWSIESGLTAREWVNRTYQAISTLLDKINNKSVTVTTERLQNLMGRLDSRDVKNVCGEIHDDSFNGRGCKVLLSTHFWVPVVGWASYVWESKWVINHVGYLVRAGTDMLIFDPNYGLGWFAIRDTQPLTLQDLTTAVMGLAWAAGFWTYYLSTTAAIAVIDEDALGLRPSNSLLEQSRQLSEAAEKFNARRLASS